MIDFLSALVALSLIGLVVLSVAALFKLVFSLLLLPLKLGAFVLKLAFGAILLLLFMTILLPVLVTVLPVVLVLLVIPALVVGSLCWLWAY